MTEVGPEELERLQQRIEEILQGVRRFSRDLRPSVLDDLGLLPAIEGLLADVRDQAVSAELTILGEKRRLSQDAELGLFRIVQEALSNVMRHAGASWVVVRVEFSDSSVRVDVRDDGQGFELLASPGDFATIGRFGLLGIEERTQLMRGHFQVRSAPGQGTMVRVDVPA
jgi:signal transduction histidine kinase